VSLAIQIVCRPLLAVVCASLSCGAPTVAPQQKIDPRELSGRPREQPCAATVTPPSFPAPPGYPLVLRRVAAKEATRRVQDALARSPGWSALQLTNAGLLASVRTSRDPARSLSLAEASARGRCPAASDEAQARAFLDAHRELLGLRGPLPPGECRAQGLVLEQRVGDRVIAKVTIRHEANGYESDTKRYLDDYVSITGHFWPEEAIPATPPRTDAELFGPWLGMAVDIYKEHGGFAPLGRPGEPPPEGFGPGWSWSSTTTFALSEFPPLHGFAVVPVESATDLLEVREVAIEDRTDVRPAACLPLTLDRHTGADLTARVYLGGLPRAEGLVVGE
jgi:hypothetical protein